RVDVNREGALAGACARARSLERGESAVGSACETVTHAAPVNVESPYRPRGVDAGRVSALKGACARAGSIDCGESAVGIAQEAVNHRYRVSVLSHNHPLLVDCVARGAQYRVRIVESYYDRL